MDFDDHSTESEEIETKVYKLLSDTDIQVWKYVYGQVKSMVKSMVESMVKSMIKSMIKSIKSYG